MSQENLPEDARHNVLPLVLGTGVLGGILLALILMTGVFFLVIVLAMAGVGLLHYLVWGQALHQRTEDLREEERLRDEMGDDPW